jgi:hypothetical protein
LGYCGFDATDVSTTLNKWCDRYADDEAFHTTEDVAASSIIGVPLAGRSLDDVTGDELVEIYAYHIEQTLVVNMDQVLKAAPPVHRAVLERQRGIEAARNQVGRIRRKTTPPNTTMDSVTVLLKR